MMRRAFRFIRTGTVGTAFGVALCLAPSVEAQDLLQRVKQRGEIHVGVELQSAPLEFTEQGQPKGYSVELMALVAADLGLKIRYTDVPFPSLLPGLDAKTFDMSGSSVTITKPRLERYHYSLPVVEGTVGLIKHKRETGIRESKDIAGKVVGAQRASSMLALLKNYSATLPGGVKEIKEYVDYNQAYADLAIGRIVAVANPLPNILYAARVRPTEFEVILPPFGPKAYLGWMVRKDDDSKPLMDEINRSLAKLNGSGKMRELQKKWMGTEMDLPADRIPEPLY